MKSSFPIRAVLVGLSWIIFQSATASYIHGNSLGQLIANHLPLGGLFFLTLLVLIVNPLIHKINALMIFSVSELVIIWIMISAASAVPGYGMMEFLFPVLVGPLQNATPQNQWKEVLLPHLPDWSYISDLQAVTTFFQGESSVPWSVWTIPAAFWLSTSLALSVIVICWSVLIRRQWVEQERYPFPLVQIPKMVVTPASGQIFNHFLRKRLLWVGLLASIGIHLLRGLHRYDPSIPYIKIAYSFAPLITEKPWVALVRGWPLWGRIYLAVIGVTYFLQLDVSFSLWFFFLFYKLQEVGILAFSIRGVSTQQQVMGADFVLIGFLTWMGRRHLQSVFLAVTGSAKSSAQDNQLMSYRLAIAGIIVGGITFVTLFSSAGMSPLVAIVFLILLLGLATITCWMVANAGMLLVNVGLAPFSLLTTFLGSRPIGRTNLTLLAFDRSVQSHWSSESLMPYVMQGLRLSDQVNHHQRKLIPLMLISILIAIGIAYVCSLKFIYYQGATSLEGWVYNSFGFRGLTQAYTAIQNPYDPSLSGIISAGVGGIWTGFLLFMRQRFLWWPFHPIGYIVGITYAPCHLWFSTLLGWTIKIVLLKFFGVGAYRRLQPLFLGLILGEYFMSAFWIFVGLLTRVSYWGLPH
ncbi:hypothetical protein CMK14_19760 [Candidatus Poribacteria bacterium]|nr:hypothetical protein [Candidatus Poribacteria bacterium]